MYKYSSGQISLSDFKQPVCMHLKEGNRWAKKAQTISWVEIEKRYAALFPTGRAMLPSHCVLPWVPASFRLNMGLPMRKQRS